MAVATLFVVNGAAAGTWLSRLPELRVDAGLDLPGLAVALVVARVGAVVGGIVAGPLVTRLGSRGAAVGFAVVNAVALVLLPHAPGLGLGLALGLLFASDAMADIGMNVQAADVETAFGRSVMQRLHAGWSLGLLGASALGGAVAATGVAPGPHLGIAALVAAVAALATMPALAHDDTRGSPWRSRERHASPSPTSRRSWGRSAVLLGVVGAATAVVEVIPTEWVTTAMTSDVGSSAGSAALALTLLSAAMLVGRLSGDWLVDRLGRDRAWRVASLLAVLGVSAFGVAPSPGLRMAAVVALGLGVAQLFPAVYRAAARTAGIGPAAGMSAMTTGARLGGLGANLLMVPATAELAVGTSMVLVVVPAGIALLLVAGRLTPSDADA